MNWRFWAAGRVFTHSPRPISKGFETVLWAIRSAPAATLYYNISKVLNFGKVNRIGSLISYAFCHSERNFSLVKDLLN